MTEEMKLREVCDKYGISRRAIQGYEKLGLVKPYRKTSYGHLLYGSEAINRIVFIRFLQNIGYSLKEIKIIIELKPNLIVNELAKALNNHNKKLKEFEMLGSKIARVINAIDSGHVLDDSVTEIITGGDNYE